MNSWPCCRDSGTAASPHQVRAVSASAMGGCRRTEAGYLKPGGHWLTKPPTTKRSHPSRRHKAGSRLPNEREAVVRCLFVMGADGRTALPPSASAKPIGMLSKPYGSTWCEAWRCSKRRPVEHLQSLQRIGWVLLRLGDLVGAQAAIARPRAGRTLPGARQPGRVPRRRRRAGVIGGER